MRAHIIENGFVVNTIEVGDLDFPVDIDQILIDGMEGGIGWLWDGSKLSAPVFEQPVPPAKTVFAPREYLKKFTMTEYAAARTHTNIGVQWALDNLIGAQFVDITDPDTIAGLDLMVAEGVITPERRTELLTPEAAE